jgi:hypothetical protein
MYIMFGKALTFLLAITYLVAPTTVYSQAEEQSRVGVGVGTGKIIIEDKLKSGARYELTPLSVINTGNVEAVYEVSLSYHEQQPEKRPLNKWFSFKPNNFTLKPGEIENVSVELQLPLQSEPGDYFAYLEAHPIQTVADGNTSVGVAAAAKLYFTVEPSNVFQALYYRALSVYERYNLLFNVIGITLGVFIVLRIMRRFVSLDIKLKPAPPNKPQSPKSSKQNTTSQEDAFFTQVRTNANTNTKDSPELLSTTESSKKATSESESSSVKKHQADE